MQIAIKLVTMGHELELQPKDKLKKVPPAYEKAMRNGVFNTLNKKERDLLIDRHEEPRLSLTKTAAKNGISVTYASDIERLALEKLRQKLKGTYPEKGDFLVPPVIREDIKANIEKAREFNLMHVLTPRQEQVVDTIQLMGSKLEPLSQYFSVSEMAISKTIRRAMGRIQSAIQQEQ